MFLRELHNLRAMIIQYLIATEHHQAPTADLVGKQNGPLSPDSLYVAAEVPAWSERRTHDRAALTWAELNEDWTSPKLAFRAEAQRDAFERRASRHH